MTEFERYLFDLQGFLVIEYILNQDEIAALQSLLDQQIAFQDDQAKFLRFDSLLPWGKPLRNLVDHPRITPYLSNLLGEKFRLDHDYVHIIRQGIGPIGSQLHGGATPYDPCQYYQFKDGRIYNGLTAVAYELNDVHPKNRWYGMRPW